MRAHGTQKGSTVMSVKSAMLSFGAVLIAASLTCAPRAHAAAPVAEGAAQEATADVLLSTLRANRKAFVAVNLQLSDEQAKAFWPLYDRYAQEIGAIGDRVASLVTDYEKSYADLSNDKALQLITGYLDAEAERAKIRRGYLDEFAKILPGRTVARFFQLENKIDAVLRYELAKTIPVVEEKPAAK
jgi:hypothetical protein